jgi:hypothetical protein
VGEPPEIRSSDATQPKAMSINITQPIQRTL